MAESMVIRVHFFEPVENKTDYYFGSLKAIYGKFTPEQVGCKLHSLYACKLGAGGRKVTNMAIVEKERIIRSNLKNTLK